MAIAAPILVVLAAVAIAAVTDVRSFKVYNKLTLPLLATGLVFHAAVNGAAGLGMAFAGAAAGFLALLAPYLLGAMGAGDVKLAAGIGAWLGASLLLPILAIGLAATAVYSLAALLLQRRIREAWLAVQVALVQAITLGRHFFAVEREQTVQEMVKQPDRRRLIPFSLMLAIGVVATLLYQLSPSLILFWQE